MFKTLFIAFNLIIASNLSLSAESMPAHRDRIGINLSGFSDWSSIMPFNDLAKQARPWRYDDNSAVIRVDDWGNWIPEKGRKPWTILLLPEARGPSGTYRVSWEGTGLVELHSLSRGVHVGLQRDRYFEIVAEASPAIALSIADSNPSDPVRNIRCMIPGSEESTTVFRSAFMNGGVKMLGSVRFMDWQHTNGSEQQRWENRPVLEQQTFRLSERKGVPIEHMVAFANETQMNPWFCIPHQADDEYVRNFAILVRDTLDKNLNVYVEYSNEIWNTNPGFKQTLYAIEKSKTIPQPIPNANVPIASWYAYRSKQIWIIWDEVFGGREAASRRLIRVAAGWYNNPAISRAKLEAYDLASSSDVYAIAPYSGLNRDINTGEFNPDNITVDDLVAQIPNQIQTFMDERLNQQVELAKSFGLPLIAYEGGIVFATPRRATNEKAATALVVAASRDQRMDAHMEMYLRMWFSKSPGVMMLFSDYHTPGRYGTYDNLGEYPGQPELEAARRRGLIRVLYDHGLVMPND